jgi:DNA mismatch repair protein MutS2
MQRELAAQSQQLAEERRALREEWVARQKTRISELEQRFAEAIAKHEHEMATTLAAVREAEARAQAEKLSRRRVVQARTEAREEADAAVVAHLSESQADLGTTSVGAGPAAPPPLDKLLPGVKIRVRGFSAPVVLRRRDSTSADVEAGPLRMKVALGEITAIVADDTTQPGKTSRPRAATPVRPAVGISADGVSTEPVDEINVIGCTVEEATRRVDKFVDNAALAGRNQVRVIHGHGTGALRRGLAGFLATHPLVGSIHGEADERGGAAVTVIELKD